MRCESCILKRHGSCAARVLMAATGRVLHDVGTVLCVPALQAARSRLKCC